MIGHVKSALKPDDTLSGDHHSFWLPLVSPLQNPLS